MLDYSFFQSNHFTCHSFWVIFEFFHIKTVLYCQSSCNKDTKCSLSKKQTQTKKKIKQWINYTHINITINIHIHTFLLFAEIWVLVEQLYNFDDIIYSQSMVSVMLPIYQFPIISKTNKIGKPMVEKTFLQNFFFFFCSFDNHSHFLGEKEKQNKTLNSEHY